MSGMQLPRLREELALLPGPVMPDGQPTWTLHDPVRNLFFQLDWPSFEILRRWHLSEPLVIARAISAETTLTIEMEDIASLARFFQANELLQIAPGVAAGLAERLRDRNGSMLTRLLHHYLFFRVPLVRPDRWLTRWAPRVGFLFSGAFRKLTAAAGVLGIAAAYRSWDVFSTTFVDLLSWEGLFAYAATLIAVKTLHELGHAFTAKRYGCRVPTMGIAFLVLWPVAYTDTNEVWKLTRRNERLQVSAAGIATELTIAVWATLAWAWLPEGLPKSIAFLLSTTTWVSTVVINASPFMRFDGYFVLSDFLQVPNLHARAFALARWHLRERLFGLGDPPPEVFSVAKTRGLIAFAWATWIYRLFLFLGIALLVYHFFIKAIGIFLFAVEITWFVLLPVWREMRAWRHRWSTIRASRRARRTALLAALLAVLLVVPWPTRIATIGLLQPREQWPIYAPEHAQVAALPFRDGAAVPAGALLIELRSPQLEARALQSEARRERLSLQSGSAGFDAARRRDWGVLSKALDTVVAERKAVAADAAQYMPRAPYAGVIRDIDPDLEVGDWVAHRELLGRLVREDAWQVVTYVDDADVHRVSVGDQALFIAEGLDGPVARLTVAQIDRDASRTLDEPQLASVFGGDVLVREKEGVFYPQRAVYRVRLEVEPGAISNQHNWRGKVAIVAQWEAPGLRFVRAALSVLWREAGF
jgi:putative peptide zinc metalloprotease protein